ncbi:PIM1 kinase, partial [Polypterus senegalus]
MKEEIQKMKSLLEMQMQQLRQETVDQMKKMREEHSLELQKVQQAWSRERDELFLLFRRWKNIENHRTEKLRRIDTPVFQEDSKTCNPKPAKDGVNTATEQTEDRHPDGKSDEYNNHSQSLCDPEEVQDWTHFLDGYIVESLLSQGGHVEVYAARRKCDDLPVAIKIMSRDSVMEWIQYPGERQAIPLEIALMKMVCSPPNFPGVIQLLDWCTDPYDVLLILERPEPCMELHYFVIEREEYLEEPLARDIFQQIVEAVQHCHSRGVFHRDVKMNNILIQIPNHQIKLIDFDCGAQVHGGDYSSFRGTSKYAPPEWFTKKRYQAVPATAWSLGIVLYGLVCAALPFHNRQETINGKVSFSRNISIGLGEMPKTSLASDSLQDSLSQPPQESQTALASKHQLHK